MSTRLVSTGIRLVPSTGHDDWYTGTAPLKGAYQYRSFTPVSVRGERESGSGTSDAHDIHTPAPGIATELHLGAADVQLTPPANVAGLPRSGLLSRFTLPFSAQIAGFFRALATASAMATTFGGYA